MNVEIAQKIVQQCNQETGLNLSYDSLTDGGSIICRDKQRRRHVIVCYNGPLNPIIRSIVREKRRNVNGGFNWLCNGQAGKNAIEVVYWDEMHRYQPTLTEVCDYLKQTYRHFDHLRYPLMGFTKEEIEMEIAK